MSSQVIDGWKPIRGVPGKTIVTQNSDGSYTVTIDPSAIGDGSGDMLKAVYDIDGNDIVDAAESVPWGGVTGKPLVFPPDEHTHSGSDVTSQVSSAASADSVPWGGVTGKPLVFPPDEHTHSGSDVTSQVSSAASADSVPWAGITDVPSTFTPSSHDHDDRYYTESETDTLLGGYVLKSTFDANSLLIANTDDTPTALTVGASTIVGRAASGGIAALSASDARTVLGLGTTDAPTFAGVVAGYVAPASDGTTAFQVRKADKSTPVVTVDTANGRVGIGMLPTYAARTLQVYGSTQNIGPSSVYSVIDAGVGASNADAGFIFRDNSVGKWILFKSGNQDFKFYDYVSGKYPINLYSNGAIVFNEDAHTNTDFRVESAGESNMVWLDASADLLYLGGSTNGVSIAKGGVIKTPTYMEYSEMTAPSGGAANTARLFARDNGSGKTQLCVIFNSGAIQVLATEP